MESCFESTGFSEGPREPAPTDTEVTADTATAPNDGDNSEQTKRGSSKNAERNEYRTEENKRDTELKLDKETTHSRTKRIPKNQEISVIFNYSKIKLTHAMENLLNRGFNFSILPLKLDLTQVLVDFKRFERSTIWQEYFYGRENDREFKANIFKSNKSNLPKNYKIPEGLKTYLGSVKSEIMDHRNRNNVKCNLPQDEILAMKELIKLQKDKIIVIKPCDKGAGIIILDYLVYMRACYEHLTTEKVMNNGDSKQYYLRVNEIELEKTKSKIRNIVQEGLDNKILSKEEYEAMLAEDKEAAKFYCTFKVHKDHQPMTAPPPRPIVSGSGSATENIAAFVEYHIKDISKQHQSYLQDTPDFLRYIENINKGPALENNQILVTWDVVGLYNNIPHEEGLESLKEGLEQRNTPEIPTDYLVRLMEIILKNNLFNFHEELWRQEIGCAMGTKPAPSYADIFMARKLDKLIISLAQNLGKNNKSPLTIFKRFLDDIFSIFQGTTKNLHKLFDEMNKLHQTIKFTMNHTSPPNESEDDRCQCSQQVAIPLLDVLCSIQYGKIETDLYRKETDRNMYLLPSSCHPPSCTKNIPFSLCLRIVRICSKPEYREKQFLKLKELMESRGYSEGTINSAIDRARGIPRNVALRRAIRREAERRSVFALTYDPRLPAIQTIQAKHWRSMVSQDPYLSEVFTQPPLTAFRRQRNIKDHIIRAKLPVDPKMYPERRQRGMKKCGKNCTACPYIREVKSLRMNGKDWKINQNLNCNTYNCVYMIECKKDNCKLKYVGETKRILKFRLADHRGYINNQDYTTATGEHFNSPGHSLSDLSITILERVKTMDDLYRREREKYFIRKFNTFYRGLNRQP